MNNLKKNELVAFALGIIIGALGSYFFIFSNNGDTHQITQPDEDYHVHADFLVFINDEKVDLSTNEFMTTSQQTVHKHAHLHDGNGEVKHIHQEDITFAEFLASLNIALTNECLTKDGTDYCNDDENVLALYVNFEPFNESLTEYVPVDDDSILLYYGKYNPEKITSYMNEVKDDSCYYSGTCPERGIAPPESCGLTCEI